MSKFSAIVCDHCDVRDLTDDGSLPQHDILSVSIAMIIDGIAGHKKAPPNIFGDLCEKCRATLHCDVIRAMTQVPREAL